MVFAKTIDGKTIPLDPKAAVYKIVTQEGDNMVVERYLSAMVNHHSTCPRVNEAPWKKKEERNRTGSDE
jgi:hypothetical protein